MIVPKRRKRAFPPSPSRLSSLRFLLFAVLLLLPTLETGVGILKEPFPPAYEYWRAPVTQIGMPNGPFGTEVTPEGDLYTGYHEFFLRYGVEYGPGRICSKHWLAGGIPIVRYYQQADGLIYQVETFGTSLNGRPDGPLADMMAVTIVNPRSWPITAVLTSGFRYRGESVYRPKPRIKFNSKWVYRFKGDFALRGGRILGQMPPSPALREGFHGQSYLMIAEGVAPRKDEDYQFRGSDRGVGPATAVMESVYKIPIRPYRQRRLVFKILHQPAGLEARSALARLDYDEEKRKIARLWDSLFDRAATFETPDVKLADMAEASIANLFIGCDVQGKWLVPRVNELQYDGFYYRDGAWMIRAFDLTGYPDQAKRCLDYFLYKQRPDGLFQSQKGQLDGWGQALWALGQHARITGDRGYEKRLMPPVEKAIKWLRLARRQDAAITGKPGLLPASDPKDNEQIAGHLFGSNFWAYRGLLEAMRIAEGAGDAKRAAEWKRDLADYRKALMAALGPATARAGGAIPPAEEPGGYDWGNLQVVSPGAFLPPDHPWVTATLNRARSQFNEGLMTYIRRDTIHGYVGFDVPETELMRGEGEKALDALLSAAAHATGANGGFEYGSARRRDYGKNLSPHGCFAAKYLSLYRNCLVRETPDALYLGSALSPAWVLPGERVRVKNAPTDFGPVSYDLDGVAGGARLTLKLDGGARTKPLRKIVLSAPVGSRIVSAEAPGGGALFNEKSVTLSPKSQSVRISWTLPRDAERWTSEAYMKRYCLPQIVTE
jgi:hypothetical protein